MCPSLHRMPTMGIVTILKFIYYIFHLVTTTIPRVNLSGHFRDEQTEAQRDLGTCSRSHVELVLSDFKFLVVPRIPFLPYDISQFLGDRILVLELYTMAVLLH